MGLQISGSDGDGGMVEAHFLTVFGDLPGKGSNNPIHA
jgi:hypothetical protein